MQSIADDHAPVLYAHPPNINLPSKLWLYVQWLRPWVAQTVPSRQLLFAFKPFHCWSTVQYMQAIRCGERGGYPPDSDGVTDRVIVADRDWSPPFISVMLDEYIFGCAYQGPSWRVLNNTYGFLTGSATSKHYVYLCLLANIEYSMHGGPSRYFFHTYIDTIFVLKETATVSSQQKMVRGCFQPQTYTAVLRTTLTQIIRCDIDPNTDILIRVLYHFSWHIISASVEWARFICHTRRSLVAVCISGKWLQQSATLWNISSTE